MFGGGLLLVLLVMVAVRLVVQQPWLGLELESTPDGGPQVVAVDPRSPLADTLQAGERLAALERADGTHLSLHGFVPRHHPYSERDFHGFNAVLAREGALHEALLAEGTVLLTADGRRIPVELAPQRPVDTLSPDFWAFHLFGLLAAMISLAVWIFRRGQPATRLLALSGAGFFAAAWSNTLYLDRELALPEDTFRLLAQANHWALALTLGGLLALLLHYPRRLLNRSVTGWLAGLFLFYQANETLQWVAWPWHAYYTPIALFYLLLMVFVALQWRLSGGQPLDRAALKWLLLSIFISVTLAFTTYIVPQLLGGEPLLGQAALLAVGAMLYVGLAAGVLRYRLFELERWWFVAWGWFLGGLLVLLVDLALILLFGLQPLHALGLAVVLVGWVYFPARQWFWRRLAGSGESRVEEQLPDLVTALFTRAGSESAEEVWRQALKSHFSPLDMQPGFAALSEPQLQASGVVLSVPGLEPGRVWQLRYASGGRRLFSEREREQAAALLAVARRVTAVAEAKEAGARTERQRIARDLHDDVAGRLLNLVHRATDETEAQRAREALNALRGAIHVLQDPAPQPLQERLEDWQMELGARVREAGARLDWRFEGGGDGELSPRQVINLQQILNEAVTNALRHARPECITIDWRQIGELLELTIANDGRSASDRSAPLEGGRGRHNMHTRAIELRGELSQGPTDDGGYRVVVRIPLRLESAATRFRHRPQAP